MKVAVARDDIRVSRHFGHCEAFSIFLVNDSEVENEELVENPGHRPGFIPKFLRDKNIDVIIAGCMGDSAKKIFDNYGIEVLVGARGNINKIIEDYVNDNLNLDEVSCQHHRHRGRRF